MKIVLGNIKSRIIFETESEKVKEEIHKIMHRKLGIRVEGAIFSRAYKSGHWDGITDFYEFEDDSFHTGLLGKVLEGIRDVQIVFPTLTYQIEDERSERLLDVADIDDEIVLGNGEDGDITLRNYQYEALVKALDKQVGILNLATNAGKCVPLNGNLLTNNGTMTLGDLFETSGEIPTTEEKVVEYKGNISLINRYGEEEKPSHLTFNGMRELKKITTSNGLVLKQTSNHPLLTLSHTGKFEWVNAEDLELGDYLVGRRGDNVFGGDKTVVDEDEAFAIGVLIADGYLRPECRIAVTNDQEEIISHMTQYFDSLRPKNITLKKYGSRVSTEINMFGTEVVAEWHERLGVEYHLSAEKEIPKVILQAPRNIQLAFLSGYIECECSMDSRERLSMEITTASHKLAEEVGLMLRNLGVLPTISKKVVKGYEEKDYLRITFGAVDTKLLLDMLNFKTEQRITQVEEFNKNYASRRRNNKKDTLPYGKLIGESYKYSHDLYGKRPKGMAKAFSIPGTISKTRLRKLAIEYPNGHPKLLEDILTITSDEYVYEEVVSIEDMEAVPTFDVHMPETHSFIAEGIINHNTEIASGIMQQLLPTLKRGETIAFFTHTKELFHQSAERIKKRLDLTDKDIGYLGDGKTDIKNKKIVFIMIPTLARALEDPRKGVKFTPKERVIKFIAEEITPKFNTSTNTRVLLRNYINNCKLTTQVWKSSEEALMYLAYDKKFTDKKARMELNKYTVELNKIIEKKNKKKYDRYNDIQKLMKSIRALVGDEIHSVKGDTWMKGLEQCTNASVRIGLTGTVDYKDEMLWQRAQAIFHEVIDKVSNDYLIENKISSIPSVRLLTITEPHHLEHENNYLQVYKEGIVENEVRNQVIAKMTIAYNKSKEGGVLISVNHVEHGERLKELIEAHGLECGFLKGELDGDTRREMMDRFSAGELPVMIGTSLINLGLDMRNIGCMILGASGKSSIALLQRVGRALRLSGVEGNRVVIFDFIDKTNKHLYKHSKERIKILKEEGFDVKEM